MGTETYQLVKMSDKRLLGFSEYGDLEGVPLFFFHGWPSSRLQAKRWSDIALKLGVRIISVDRPGYGVSDYQSNRTLLDWPDDILDLADNLRIKKFAVAGVSGGGPYAAVCAYKIPERLTKVGIVVGLAKPYLSGMTEGISVLNRLGWDNYRNFPLLRYVSSVLGLIDSKIFPDYLSFLAFPSKSDRILANKELIQATRNSRKEAFKQGMGGALSDLDVYSNDWGFDLKKINVPVFLWYGDDDENVSLNMGKYYHAQIPGSKLVVYPNEGHLVSVTHGEEIINLLTT